MSHYLFGENPRAKTVVPSVTKAFISEISDKKDHEVDLNISVADMETDEATDKDINEDGSKSNVDTDQEEYVVKKERDGTLRPFNLRRTD